MRNIRFIAWSTLALAVFGWILVMYAGAALLNEASARAEAATSAEAQSDRAAYSSRLRALAVETKNERERLEQLARADVISIVNTIEAVGKSAGVSAEVSDALPEGSGTELPGGARFVPVAFVVQARGNFSNLMHAVSLFEHLPLPSTVTQIEVERVGDTPNASWVMTARIVVLTAAQISL